MLLHADEYQPPKLSFARIEPLIPTSYVLLYLPKVVKPPQEICHTHQSPRNHHLKARNHIFLIRRPH